MTADIRKSLVKIESGLAGCVQKTVMMGPEEFLTHAKSEIGKAKDEPEEKARKRLFALQKSVLYSSDIIEDTEADGIKIPVCVIEQTAVDEQENTLMTPAASAAKNPSDGTVFEDGFIAKKLLEIESLLKSFGKPPTPPTPPAPPTPPGASPAPAAAAPKDDEEEETEKKAPAFPGAAPPFGAGGKPGEKKPEDDKDKTKTGKVEKLWPDDMNDPEFVEKGITDPETDWGNDPS